MPLFYLWWTWFHSYGNTLAALYSLSYCVDSSEPGCWLCFSVGNYSTWFWIRLSIPSCGAIPQDLYRSLIFSLPIGGEIMWQLFFEWLNSIYCEMRLNKCRPRLQKIRTPYDCEVYPQIKAFYEDLRSRGRAMPIKTLCVKFGQLMPACQISQSPIYQRIRRFTAFFCNGWGWLKREGIFNRRVTHVGQKHHVSEHIIRWVIGSWGRITKENITNTSRSIGYW